MGKLSSLFKQKSANDQSVLELIATFNSILPRDTSVDFGVRKVKGVSIGKARAEANAKALGLLRMLDVQSDFAGEIVLTEEQKQTLRGYTGEGGIGGSIDEYYTPEFLAKGSWSALKAYGFENGNVCEPSCGTGVFNSYKPDGVIMTGAEVSKVSSTINQILHPEDVIHNVPFEELAKQTPDGHFDAFIGNVPFGATRGEYGALDPSYRKYKTPEEYFVMRAVDKVKDGGLVVLTVPTRIVSGKDLTKFRRLISKNPNFWERTASLQAHLLRVVLNRLYLMSSFFENTPKR